MNIKTKIQRKLELFNPVSIKLLVDLSDIEPDYLHYPEENKEKGSIMELEYTPSGIFLNQSGRCFLSELDNIDLIEGTHFEFI